MAVVMSRKQNTLGRVATENTSVRNISSSYKHSAASQQTHLDSRTRDFDLRTQIPSHSLPITGTSSILSSVLESSYNFDDSSLFSETPNVPNRNPRKLPDKTTHLSPRRSPSYDQLRIAEATSPVSGSTSTQQRARNNLLVPAHRNGSAPGSRKSSAASQDRDATGHLDLKRLLSKPAQHTTSSSSAVSLMSDSEISVSSQNIILPYLTTEPLQRPFISRSSNHSPSVPISASSSRSPSSHRACSRDASSSPGGVEKQLMQQHHNKPRNVLRRRASTRSSPSAPLLETLKSDTEGAKVLPAKPSKHRFRSIEALYPHHSNRPSTAPRDTPSSGVSSSRSKDPLRSPGLTPAGAVVQAYKEQEQRRERLADIAGWDDRAMGSNRTKSMDLSQRDEETSGGAYYSVFGSTSGRLVAVGSPMDDSWDVSALYAADALNTSIVRSPASDKGKSLTRKVSGRLRKVADTIKKDKEVLATHSEISPHRAMSEGWKPYDGHPSVVHERRSETLPRAGKSAGRSLEEYVDVEIDETTGRVIPIATNSSPTISEKVRDYGPMVPTSSKAKKPAHDETSGGKWWKLVKRISTGALRDKYRDTTPPPPVPALPANLQQHARASLSGTSPSTSSHKTARPPPSLPSQISSNRSPNSASGSHPSLVTRSSSPVSSEVASSGLFHPNVSARSSTSSYGEELRSTRNDSDPHVGQHIIPPDELYRLNQDREKKGGSSSRSTSRPVRTREAASKDDRTHSGSLEAKLKSLPLPPRRVTTNSHDSGASRDVSPSPTVPSSSTADPLKNLPLSDMFEFGVGSPSSPPSRPIRSERRKPASIHVPPPSTSISQQRSPVTPRANHPTLVIDVLTPTRTPPGPSSGSSTTKRGPSSASSSTPPSSVLSSSKKRSPVTFRELESPRAAWSEKEKADKWEDLLRRSARAGGTLHIGESGLLSEGLQLSDYSEPSDLSDV